jgi:hypothetical protein
MSWFLRPDLLPFSRSVLARCLHARKQLSMVLQRAQAGLQHLLSLHSYSMDLHRATAIIGCHNAEKVRTKVSPGPCC